MIEIEQPTEAKVNRRRRQEDDGRDDILVLEEKYPLIAPGQYEAVSKSVTRRNGFRRSFIEARFLVFEGAMTDGVILAREVPGFFALPAKGGKVGRSSRLARWIQLLDSAARMDRIPMRTLVDKLWKVQVVTVERDAQLVLLATQNQYSKVANVLVCIPLHRDR